MSHKTVYVLRCTSLPLDTFVIGVYTTKKAAVDAWQAYCEGGYKKDFGHRQAMNPHAFDIKRHLLDK